MGTNWRQHLLLRRLAVTKDERSGDDIGENGEPILGELSNPIQSS